MTAVAPVAYGAPIAAFAPPLACPARTTMPKIRPCRRGSCPHQPIASAEPSSSTRQTPAPADAPRATRVTLAPGRHWTNPERTLLTLRSPRASSRLHTVDRTYTWLKTFDVGARATVIAGPFSQDSPSAQRRPLLIYSPLPLTPDLCAAIDAVGDVVVVVAPNNEHVDFVAPVADAYPDAVVLGPTDCVKKFPHLPFTAATFSGGEDDGGEPGTSPVPHPALAVFAPHVVPLFVPAAPFFNETVLLVRDEAEPEGRRHTLVVCDLVWNYPRPAEAAAAGVELPINTRVWAQAMNRVYAPVYNRVLVRDRGRYARFLHGLKTRGVDRIIPCHGNVVERDGMSVLDSFFPNFLKRT